MTDFQKKSSNVIFHQNLSNGSRVVPCAQTDMIISTFCNYVNAPKNTEALVVASEKIVLEVIAEKTKYVAVPQDQNSGQNSNIEIGK